MSNPCLTCRHYHGRTYNDVRLVCAIHPSGPGCNPCPDYEQLTAEAPRTEQTLPFQHPAIAPPAPQETPRDMFRRIVNSLLDF